MMAAGTAPSIARSALRTRPGAEMLRYRGEPDLAARCELSW